MNRLLLLNEDLVQRASTSTVKPAVPISVKKADLPVKPRASWRKLDNKLKKIFNFDDLEARNFFLYQLLAYEYEKGHNAVLVVDEKKVDVTVTTHDLGRITEIDEEYARALDQIYAEVKDATDG